MVCNYCQEDFQPDEQNNYNENFCSSECENSYREICDFPEGQDNIPF
jgi:hypothetical protein